MKFEETNIENDLDFDLADGLEPERLVLPSTLVIDQAETERILKYCIIAALLLHVLLLIIVTKVGRFQPSHSLLRPGEKVTQVRLVEPQESWKDKEPPPQQAAAISDRDHTAQAETSQTATSFKASDRVDAGTSEEDGFINPTSSAGGSD